MSQEAAEGLFTLTLSAEPAVSSQMLNGITAAVGFWHVKFVIFIIVIIMLLTQVQKITVEYLTVQFSV